MNGAQESMPTLRDDPGEAGQDGSRFSGMPSSSLQAAVSHTEPADTAMSPKDTVENLQDTQLPPLSPTLLPPIPPAPPSPLNNSQNLT